MTGQTNWGPYNVPELAGILDDDLTDAWSQVNAWFSADAMLDDAARKLDEARTGLAAVWPPESSPAAKTFFKVVDDLTESMRKTSLASNTNANALAQVLNTHDSTKSEVDGLHSAWTASQRLAPANPTDFPSTVDWQSSLNAQAQQHMAAADTVIGEYAATLVVPPVIPVPNVMDTPVVIPGSSDGTPSSSGGGGAAGTSGGGVPAPTRTRSGAPGGSIAPLPGVPILTGGGLPPTGGAPGRPGGPGPGLPGVPMPGSLGNPGGPGIPVPVMPGGIGFPGEAPPGTGLTGVGEATSSGTRAGGLAPGEPVAGRGAALGGLPAEALPGAGGAAGGLPGEAGTGFVGAPTGGAGIASGASGRGSGTGAARMVGDGRLGARAGTGAAFGDPATAAWRGGSVLGRDGTLRPGGAPSAGYLDGSAARGGTVATDVPAGVTGSAAGAEGMVPMMGGAGGSSGGRRTGRGLADVAWPMPAGGPAVLTPEVENDVHDPGPGVIGIDR